MTDNKPPSAPRTGARNRATTQNPGASEWCSARGEKWRANLTGMEAMLAPVDVPLIAALDLRAPRRIADIGCGGGRTTLEIARRAAAGSVVHGFDIAPGMVEVARARSDAESLSVSFEVGDVSTMPAPTEPYGLLVSRFGLMFFDDPPSAFTNLSGWLAKGGRFAFAVWGPLAQNPWLTNVRDVVASAVALPAPDPDGPGPFRYADAQKLVGLLERAGFSGVEVRDFHGALPIGGNLPAAQAATFAIASLSSFNEVLAEADDSVRAHVLDLVTTRFAEHERDGAVWLAASVHILTGTRA